MSKTVGENMQHVVVGKAVVDQPASLTACHDIAITEQRCTISGMTDQHRHPVNRQLLDQAPVGSRIADRVTAFLGSWRFIVLQTVIVTIWIAINIYHFFNAAFDPYPFILLNLAFSTQAAYAAPLILLAGNRTALRDRLTLEHAAAETDIAERQNSELLTADLQILGRLEEILRRLEHLDPGEAGPRHT